MKQVDFLYVFEENNFVLDFLQIFNQGFCQLFVVLQVSEWVMRDPKVITFDFSFTNVPICRVTQRRGIFFGKNF